VRTARRQPLEGRSQLRSKHHVVAGSAALVCSGPNGQSDDFGAHAARRSAIRRRVEDNSFGRQCVSFALVIAVVSGLVSGSRLPCWVSRASIAETLEEGAAVLH